jgi:hypothetical protein
MFRVLSELCTHSRKENAHIHKNLHVKGSCQPEAHPWTQAKNLNCLSGTEDVVIRVKVGPDLGVGDNYLLAKMGCSFFICSMKTGGCLQKKERPGL